MSSQSGNEHSDGKQNISNYLHFLASYCVHNYVGGQFSFRFHFLHFEQLEELQAWSHRALGAKWGLSFVSLGWKELLESHVEKAV